MKPSVLALDLATTTGWAWHAEGMPRPFFGAFTLPGDPGDVGRPADALERWLRSMYLRTRDAGSPITHWYFEAQHLGKPQGKGGKGGINIETVYRLIALGGVVEKFAYQVKPTLQKKPWCYKVHISEWRKHFLGRGSGFKRGKDGKYLPGEDPKDIAIQRCSEYGWHTDIADAAEACGILDFGLSLIPDYERPWRDALLMKTMERK